MAKIVVKKPKVTVLMPVYNAESFVAEAIQSILRQTYRDFEFLIIDDGSTDNSLEIIRSFNDDRIRIVCNEKNLKIVETLNFGIRNASGEYLIRMDADDISLPDRLEKQVYYLDTHKDVSACGSWIEMFSDESISVYRPQTDPDRIKSAFIFRTEIMHPSVAIRKSVLLENNLFYDPLFSNAEDYDLFLRLSFFTSLGNINKVLLKYRIRDNSITQVADKDEEIRGLIHKQIYAKALRFIGLEPNEEMLNLHRFLYLGKAVDSMGKMKALYEHLMLIENTNHLYNSLNHNALRQELGHQMFLLTKKASILGFKAYLFYLQSKYRRYNAEGLNQNLKLFLKCMIRHRIG